MVVRTVQASATGIFLLALLAWWFGWTSPKSVLDEVDKVRPTSALCKEYEGLMLAKASEVQAQTVTIRQLENQLKAIDQESTALDRELARSQEKIGFMLSGVRSAQNGQVLVGSNVALKREDVERDIKTAAQAHRRMEARKVDIRENSERIRAQIEALTESTDRARELLLDMKGKLNGWRIAALQKDANAIDPDSIEGEILSARERVKQLEIELSRRSFGTELVANPSRQRNWDAWMSGSADDNFWVAEAEAIAGGHASDDPPTLLGKR